MEKKTRLLVVDDEANIRNVVREYAEFEGYEVAEAADGMEAVTKARAEDFDLIVMDVMMPRLNGFAACKEIRKTKNTPVIMLSARGEEYDKEYGFEAGVDDYVIKPFSPKELVARIKAVMRRISPMAVEEVIEMQGLSLDPTSHRVMAGEEPLEMGPTEFKLLHFFMTHPERVYSREQLLNHVWGTNVYVEDRTVDVHIRRLRKALEPGGHDRMVQTVRGTGYRFSTRF